MPVSTVPIGRSGAMVAREPGLLLGPSLTRRSGKTGFHSLPAKTATGEQAYDACPVRGSAVMARMSLWSRAVGPLPGLPEFDVVICFVRRPAKRNPAARSIDEKWTTANIDVVRVGASLCASTVRPRDHPAPVALVHGCHDPFVVRWRGHFSQVFSDQAMRFFGIEVPRQVAHSARSGAGWQDLLTGRAGVFKLT
jgi:hypothetical protein